MELQQVTGSRTQKYSKTNKKPTSEKSSKSRKPKKTDRRIFISLFIFFALASFVLGTVIGYGVIGDGNASDVFQVDTWTHLYKLVFG